MIINLRGTSGSGKTWAVRRLMDLAAAQGTAAQPLNAEISKPNKITGYRVGLPSGHPVYILGSYANTCGGCDTIKTQDEVCDRVRHYATQGHVVFEGLLISHLFSRYQALDRELQPIPFVWAFPNTPLDVCLQRVQARRDARGRATTPLNPQNTTRDWYATFRVFAKCTAAGLDVRWVDYLQAGETTWAWLLAAPPI